ncbi:MAG TPA: hypothetical protein VGV67_10015 [Solirubrobacteraceae bacterium]|nr:hypothetical protein [Solirubrobacteraceae bacterium]
MTTSFEIALEQWREGERRMVGAPLEQRAELERVVKRIVAELRKRLGGTFTTDELTELYERGTAWCTDLAADVAPDAPWAWDARTVADAAFLRYVRDARDFAGGRRTGP